MTAAQPIRQQIGPGLGASEIAAALGLNPYRSPLALWEEKVGEREPFEGNEFTEWGLLVEPALLTWYERRLPDGHSLDRPLSSLYHPTLEWARCTPDALVLCDGRLCWAVQCKNAAFWSGRRWDEGPPDEVRIQCQWEMFVTGGDRTDVVAALGGMPPQAWTEWRDQVIIDDLEAAARKFWILVEMRTPPPVDDSEDWRARFARAPFVPGLVVPASPETDELATLLQGARAANRELERSVNKYKNEICQVMANGGADALDTHLGVVTWRKRADGIRVFNVPREWDKGAAK